MKLVIFNGSPRYKKSNSALLTEQFLAGYNRISKVPVPVFYLANPKQREVAKSIFDHAETVLFVFPLYTDCMPGIVKEFFESIASTPCSVSKKLGFIVQSGFPEAIHSVALERYLKKFTQRLGCEYLGTVIKGGVEGIQVMPPAMTRKMFGQFVALGEYFAVNEEFDPGIVSELRKPFVFSKTYATLFHMLSKTGVTNFYWNGNLKKNGAYGKRFDKPFVD